MGTYENIQQVPSIIIDLLLPENCIMYIYIYIYIYMYTHVATTTLHTYTSLCCTYPCHEINILIFTNWFTLFHCDYEAESNDLGEHTNLKQTILEKDLGIWVEIELTFSHHCGNQVAKENRTLGMICHAYSYLDGGSLMRLYISLIQPSLEYGYPAWAPSTIKTVNYWRMHKGKPENLYQARRTSHTLNIWQHSSYRACFTGDP